MGYVLVPSWNWECEGTEDEEELEGEREKTRSESMDRLQDLESIYERTDCVEVLAGHRVAERLCFVIRAAVDAQRTAAKPVKPRRKRRTHPSRRFPLGMLTTRMY